MEGHSLAQNGHQVTQMQNLQVFPAASSLEFLGMKKAGPLTSTTTGNQQVIMMTERFSKLTVAILTTKINSMQIATVILKNWIVQNGIPSYILTDNGSSL